MSATSDMHARVRAAVAAAIEGGAGFTVYRQAELQPTLVDLPCVVAAYETGTEQIRFGNNREDEVGYPVLLGLLLAEPVNGDDGTGSPHLTRFRDSVRGLFHNRPLAGVQEVVECEVVPQPVVQKLDGFDQLKTSMGVVAWARVPRTPTWSA